MSRKFSPGNNKTFLFIVYLYFKFSIGQFYWTATLNEATGENWFPLKEVKEKRAQIAELIMNQAQAENEGKLIFPALKFASPVRRTSKRREKKPTWDDTELEFVQENLQSGRKTRSKERRGQPGDGRHTGSGRLTRKTARAAETNQVNRVKLGILKQSLTFTFPSNRVRN